jgi:hypothetical protein
MVMTMIAFVVTMTSTAMMPSFLLASPHFMLMLFIPFGMTRQLLLMLVVLRGLSVLCLSADHHQRKQQGDQWKFHIVCVCLLDRP